jgi:D-apionate oxidoisomerase
VKKVALLGAGGKMGCRITDNLKNHLDYELLPIEISPEGIERLSDRNLVPIPAEEALPVADFVILALPDRILGKVAHDVVPQMKPRAMFLTLDPAAAYAGELPDRDDVAAFVTHPCHPPLWADEETPEAKADVFGGVAAKQAIVCALISGSEADYLAGEQLAIAMYRPVTRSHRITVEQMAILEPAMAETVVACACTIIKEAMDEAIARGVPEEAARDFMMGHVNIPLAIVFGKAGNPFSDGAKLIIEHGKKMVFKEDWKRVFEPESVKAQVQAIVSGKLPD